MRTQFFGAFFDKILQKKNPQKTRKLTASNFIKLTVTLFRVIEPLQKLFVCSYLIISNAIINY